MKRRRGGRLSGQPWGLYDTHGNVWEWVEDCWNDRYERAPDDGRARTRGDCHRRVLRGGSWVSKPVGLRSACSVWRNAANRHDSSGFRVARTLTL
ncbi:MAG: formylglycine-generating enzyme family protein [Geminicoccaceae bacterium]